MSASTVLQGSCPEERKIIAPLFLLHHAASVWRRNVLGRVPAFVAPSQSVDVLGGMGVTRGSAILSLLKRRGLDLGTLLPLPRSRLEDLVLVNEDIRSHPARVLGLYTTNFLFTTIGDQLN